MPDLPDTFGEGYFTVSSLSIYFQHQVFFNLSSFQKIKNKNVFWAHDTVLGAFLNTLFSILSASKLGADFPHVAVSNGNSERANGPLTVPQISREGVRAGTRGWLAV